MTTLAIKAPTNGVFVQRLQLNEFPGEITWFAHPLTKAAGPFRVGTLTVLIGPTGSGKSTVVEQQLLHCARLCVPTRVAGTEMDSSEFLDRMAARRLGYDIDDLLHKRYEKLAGARPEQYGEAEWAERGAKVKEAIEAEVDTLRGRLGVVSWYDNPMPWVDEILRDIARFGKWKGNRDGLYVLDHPLQLQYEQGRNGMADPGSIRIGLAKIIAAAKTHRCALLVPHQMNRTGEQEMYEFRQPGKHWIQGSSGVEQLANKLVFMLRPLKPEHEKDSARIIKDVRDKKRTWSETADPTRTCFIVGKSRDKGWRPEENEGTWSSRTLQYSNGYYRSLDWVTRTFLRKINLDDSLRIPTEEEIDAWMDAQGRSAPF